jgi:CRISPR-associated protein Csy3
LWRNRIGAEQIEVEVGHIANNAAVATWHFDALSLSLRNFYATGETKQALDSMTDVMAKALKADSALFHITAFVRIGRGQEVFPSQELILDTGRSRGEKSRTLYHVNGTAAMHSQKVGNAIRTIDTWYPEPDELGPIAVEPYGSVTTLGKAFRQPKQKFDFYTLLDDWIVGDKNPPVEQQHYVIAVLARGGVFGEKEED